MELDIYDCDASLVVSEVVFNKPLNIPLVHQVITAYLAGSRQGTKAQKSRSEVVGSNKKPWRQKGTGRARAGSVKSPIWRSGGVTFASKTNNYNQKVNKKMYRGALCSIFSELLRSGRLIIVKDFLIEFPKSSLLIALLKKMEIFGNNILIIMQRIEKNLFLSARNLYKVQTSSVFSINPMSLILNDYIIITSDCIKEVERILL